MARSSTSTLIPLDRWAQVMGINLAHFNNLDDGTPAGASRGYWTQPDHDLLALYIRQAESMLAKELGFDVAPVDCTARILFAPPTPAKWQYATLRTPHGYVQGFGSLTYTLIEAGAQVVYTDTMGTVTVTGTHLTENLVAYYRIADGGLPTVDSWAIPLSVTLNTGATSATLQGYKPQFAVPGVRHEMAPARLDNSTNFVSAVDVYQVSVDHTLPLTLVWDAITFDSSADPGSDYTETGVAYLVDQKSGTFRVRPAAWDGSGHVLTQPTYSTPPDAVIADYIAGYAKTGGMIDPVLEAAVIHLANVLMPDALHWMNDAAKTRWAMDRQEPDPVLQSDLENPFGISMAARLAWRTVSLMGLERRPF